MTPRQAAAHKRSRVNGGLKGALAQTVNRALTDEERTILDRSLPCEAELDDVEDEAEARRRRVAELRAQRLDANSRGS